MVIRWVFLDWAVRNGVAGSGREASLRRQAAEGGVGESFLEEARELREALYRAFSALAAGEAPRAIDLEILDRWLSAALPTLRLRRRDDRFEWSLARPPETLEELLWPIALYAADLLRSDLLPRVKECDGETCSWLFIDRSRNRSRRWCDMADCGNRAKARRFHRRHRRS